MIYKRENNNLTKEAIENFIIFAERPDRIQMPILNVIDMWLKQNNKFNITNSNDINYLIELLKYRKQEIT